MMLLAHPEIRRKREVSAGARIDAIASAALMRRFATIRRTYRQLSEGIEKWG